VDDMHTKYLDNHKSERISIRLDYDIKQKISEAAAIDHRSITSFIISSAIDSAKKILDKNNYMHLSEKDWGIFYNTLNNPSEPNDALRLAYASYKNISINPDLSNKSNV
jgi:uncharacterized protein (DUF1778 family)